MHQKITNSGANFLVRPESKDDTNPNTWNSIGKATDHTIVVTYPKFFESPYFKKTHASTWFTAAIGNSFVRFFSSSKVIDECLKSGTTHPLCLPEVNPVSPSGPDMMEIFPMKGNKVIVLSHLSQVDSVANVLDNISEVNIHWNSRDDSLTFLQWKFYSCNITEKTNRKLAKNSQEIIIHPLLASLKSQVCTYSPILTRKKRALNFAIKLLRR